MHAGGPPVVAITEANTAKKCNKCTIAHNVMHITDLLKGTHMEADLNGHFPNSNVTQTLESGFKL